MRRCKKKGVNGVCAFHVSKVLYNRQQLELNLRLFKRLECSNIKKKSLQYAIRLSNALTEFISEVYN
jgi:hypothetical protein